MVFRQMLYTLFNNWGCGNHKSLWSKSPLYYELCLSQDDTV